MRLRGGGLLRHHLSCCPLFFTRSLRVPSFKRRAIRIQLKMLFVVQLARPEQFVVVVFPFFLVV